MIDRKLLEKYYKSSQSVAEAIKEVLGLDVSMLNENMYRVSGTGIYFDEIGKKISEDSIFGSCLRLNKALVVIDDRGEKRIYESCSNRVECGELAVICVPIRNKDRTVGVIGVVGRSSDQRKQISNNQDIYLNYLEKMSILLGSKYGEMELNNIEYEHNKRMGEILNSINSGVVLYREDGEILYTNSSLDRILEEVGISNKSEFISEIKKHELLQELLITGACIRPCEVAVDILGAKYTLMMSINYLNIVDDCKEILLTIQNIEYFKKQVMQSIEKNHIRLKFDNILGISRKISDIKRLAEKAASSESNILIQGESGTGKEMFARAIHNSSSRKDYPFVPINCGAIPYDLFESEIFGYVKGAYTGAHANKIGKFEVADKGTIFLDEIGEIPLDLQVKLLRVLQEREVCRIGSNIIKKVDVKIIAASNKDLLKNVENGHFREDLYYRLNVIPINIPSLKERPEDILYIANHFLKYYAKLLGKDIFGIDEAAIRLMMDYSWPGNVRELQNIIEYACNFELDNTIGKSTIEKRLRSNEEGKIYDLKGLSLSKSLSVVEGNLIRDCVNKYLHSNNKEEMIFKICRELDISRATLYRKLKEYNIILNNDTNLRIENL